MSDNLTPTERETLELFRDGPFFPELTNAGWSRLNDLCRRGLVTTELRGKSHWCKLTDAGRAALAAEDGPQDDELARLRAENARLRSEDGPYERTLEVVDTFAHEHFTAVGRPVPKWANFGEGALALKDELARMRAENEMAAIPRAWKMRSIRSERVTTLAPRRSSPCRRRQSGGA